MGKAFLRGRADDSVREHIIAVRGGRGRRGEIPVPFTATARIARGRTMTNPGARGRLAVGWRWLAAVAAAVVLLAGCELATGTVRTATELQDAGIRNPDLQYDNGEARIEYDPSTGPLERRAEQDRAAGIVWRNLPFRLDRITVTARGGGLLDQRDYPREVLEASFGPRPEGLDRSPGEIARRALLWATIGGLLFLLAVVLIIVLVVRAVRRRPTPQPAGAWQAPPPQQPWGQPGQPGYGQQPYGQQGPSWTPPPQGATQPWYQQPPSPGQQGQPWPQRPPAAPGPAAPEPGEADDWPAGAPEPDASPAPETPPRGGQAPPPRDRGPAPPS
jgi:hypothetical protein